MEGPNFRLSGLSDCVLVCSAGTTPSHSGGCVSDSPHPLSEIAYIMKLLELQLFLNVTKQSSVYNVIIVIAHI